MCLMKLHLFSQQAIWFTAEQGLDGPVYGAADQWNGIGIFFDSFDNDGKVGVESQSGKVLSCERENRF